MKVPRRDRIYATGRRAGMLTSEQSAAAWQHLAFQLEELGDKDLPMFRDLLGAIRSATILARSTPTEVLHGNVRTKSAA